MYRALYANFTLKLFRVTRTETSGTDLAMSKTFEDYIQRRHENIAQALRDMKPDISLLLAEGRQPTDQEKFKKIMKKIMKKSSWKK